MPLFKIMFKRLVCTLLALRLGAQAFGVTPNALKTRSSFAKLQSAKDDLARANPDGFVNKVSVAVMNSPLNSFKQAIAKMGTGDYDAVKIQSDIKSSIANNKVLVYSWTSCPFCKKAKAQLADVLPASEFKVVELDTEAEGKAYRYELSKITGRTSVPQIWIKGEFVGGCNDGPGVVTLQSQGKLVPMLKAAGCKVK